MDLKAFTELLDAIVWPTVVGGALIVFQKPLSKVVAGIGQRVTKLSAFEISIELATMPEPPSPWTDPSMPQSSELRGGK